MCNLCRDGGCTRAECHIRTLEADLANKTASQADMKQGGYLWRWVEDQKQDIKDALEHYKRKLKEQDND